MSAHRVAAGIFGAGGVIRDGLNLEDVQAAKFGDLVKAEGGVVDQPAGRCMGHEWLGHGSSPVGRK